ncbi:Arginyl-tRNA--protein transferase 1 [Sporothrix epigloea]|uniref:Arginyl-tRNA--protein transferase 1 n=1 Tax=Sporothrix epigloea TaxID=1892477 RepID=A0ABP0DQ58_9PEZI
MPTQAVPFESTEQGKPIEPSQRFEVTLESDAYSDEKYAVFENYQRIVHKEPSSKITKNGFTNFLCDSPIWREFYTDDQGRRRQLGSFHQCYRLDGRLVAIGVLDLLPDCVSSVYFFYHESIHTYSPGKLSAMREIALARELGYRWWYSGYYIHGCPKMRYKLDFSPQYVLDPEVAASWDLWDKKALELFNKQSYVSFSHERAAARKRETDASSVDCAPRECNISSASKATSHCSDFNAAVSAPTPGGDVSVHCGDNRQPEESSDAAIESKELYSESEDEDNQPLFSSNMPGLPNESDVANYRLGDLLICTSHQPGMFPIKHLVAWHEGSYIDNESFKNKVAELVAMLGSDLKDQLCIDFRRQN